MRVATDVDPMASFAGLLIVSLGPVAMTLWTANLGGRIRHVEIAPAAGAAAAQVDREED